MSKKRTTPKSAARRKNGSSSEDAQEALGRLLQLSKRHAKGNDSQIKNT